MKIGWPEFLFGLMLYAHGKLLRSCWDNVGLSGLICLLRRSFLKH